MNNETWRAGRGQPYAPQGDFTSNGADWSPIRLYLVAH